MAEEWRIRPTLQGRTRLLAAIEAVGQPHVVDSGTLGEYAQLLAERGQIQATAAFPDVSAHLTAGCAVCADDLRELIALASAPDDDGEFRDLAEVGGNSGEPRPPEPRLSEAVRPLASEDEVAGAGAGPSARTTRPENDSGFHVRDLPDARRAEAESLRRQRLRWWRDRLLVAAALAVLLMGLSLIGLAYLASSAREVPRIGLTPMPATAPGQPAPPVQQVPVQPAPASTAAPPASSRSVTPNGMNCPASHPIKGNRESMIYHLPGGGFYVQTRPEFCFALPADAEAAGFRRSQR